MRTFIITKYLLLLLPVAIILNIFISSLTLPILSAYIHFWGVYSLISILKCILFIIYTYYVVSSTILLIEIVHRIKTDSLKNLFVSHYASYTMQFFLKRDDDSDLALRYNKAIKRLKMDVRIDRIYLELPLPNHYEEQSAILAMKDPLANQVAHMFPEYTYSGITRKKNKLIMEGTKTPRQ